MIKTRPQGAECFIDGSYYKTARGKVFRHDGVEWVLSHRRPNAVLAVIKSNNPYKGETFRDVQLTQPVGLLLSSYRYCSNG